MTDESEKWLRQRRHDQPSSLRLKWPHDTTEKASPDDQSKRKRVELSLKRGGSLESPDPESPRSHGYSTRPKTGELVSKFSGAGSRIPKPGNGQEQKPRTGPQEIPQPRHIQVSSVPTGNHKPQGKITVRSHSTKSMGVLPDQVSTKSNVHTVTPPTHMTPTTATTTSTRVSYSTHATGIASTYEHKPEIKTAANAHSGAKVERSWVASESQLPEESIALISMSDGHLSDRQTDDEQPHLQTHDVEESWVNVVKTDVPQETNTQGNERAKMLIQRQSVRQEDVANLYSRTKQPQAQSAQKEPLNPTDQGEGEDKIVLNRSSMRPEQLVHMQSHGVQPKALGGQREDGVTTAQDEGEHRMVLHKSSMKPEHLFQLQSQRKQPQAPKVDLNQTKQSPAQGGPKEDLDTAAQDEGGDKIVLNRGSMKLQQFLQQREQPGTQRENLGPLKQPQAQTEDLDPLKQPQAQGGQKEDATIRVLRKLKDEAREERDKAVHENELLKQNVELARTNARKVIDDLRARYEGQLREQQTQLDAAEHKLAIEQQRSRQMYQAELQKKETEHRERIASMQTSSDATSRLQVIEAQYQQEIQQLKLSNQQKQRNHEVEMHQLKRSQEQAIQRERETRAEMGRMQDQFQAELKRNEDQFLERMNQEESVSISVKERGEHRPGSREEVSISGVSLGPNERYSSGNYVGTAEDEGNDGDKVLAAHSICRRHYSHLTSESSDSSIMAEHLRRMTSESSDGERTRMISETQREVGELKMVIGFKEHDIETLSEQLKLKDERITALNEVIGKHKETAKRGLRDGDVDLYTEQVTTLTEQLSKYDESDRKQKNEIAKLKLKVKEAEEVEKQYDGTTVQMSQYASENKALTEKVMRLEREGATRMGDRGQLHDGTTASLQSEIQRLLPFEAEVQKLSKSVSDVGEYRKLATDYQVRLTQTQGELEQKKREIARLQAEKPPLSVGQAAVLEFQKEISGLKRQLHSKQQERDLIKGAPVAEGTTDSDTTRLRAQISHLKKQLETREAQISELESENTSLLSGSSHAQWLTGEVTKHKNEVEAKEKEVFRLQMEVERHKASSEQPVSKGTSPEVAELQQALKEKDTTLVKLSLQLAHFQKTAKDLTKIVEHSKAQSIFVKDLKEELAKEKGEKSELQAQKDELHIAKESVQAEIDSLQKSRGGLETALIASRNTTDRLREERDKLKTKIKLADSQFREVQDVNGKLRKELTTVQEKAQVSLDTALRERDHWQQKSISQQANLDNMAQDLAQKRREVTQMSATVAEQGNELQRLARQNTDLLSEVEVHKVTAQTFQEDFTQERKDREHAHSRFADMEKHYTEQKDGLKTQLQLAHHELDTHKQSLTNMEAMFQTKVNQMKQELEGANAQTGRLHEEVLSKTQQVKQYKKQVDQLKEELEAYKHQSEVHKEQVEFFARKTEEQAHELDSLRFELEKLRREKEAVAQERTRNADGAFHHESSRREAFERKIAGLERMNDQLKQDIRTLQVENEHLKQRLGIPDPVHQRPYPPSNAQPYPTTHPPPHSAHPAGPRYDHQARIQRQQGKSYSVDDPRLNPRGDPQAQPFKAVATRGGTFPSNANRAGLVQSNNHYPIGGVPAGGLPPMQPSPYPPQPGMNEYQRQMYQQGHYPSSPGPASLPSGLAEHGHGQKQPTHRGQQYGDGVTHDLVEKDSPPSSFVSNQPQQIQQPRKPVSQQIYNAGGGGRNQRQLQEMNAPQIDRRQLQEMNAPQVGRQHLLGNAQYRLQPNFAVVPGAPLQAQHASPVALPPQPRDKYPMQETQPHPRALKPSSSQIQPSHVHSKPPIGRQGSLTQPQGASAGVSGDSNTLLTGIDREIYHVAKNVIQKEPVSSSPAQEDIPYDPNLKCPRCGQQYKLGEIQKFRKHVNTCQVPAAK